MVASLKSACNSSGTDGDEPNGISPRWLCVRDRTGVPRVVSGNLKPNIK